ncbi:uncharacterized protein LOC124130706 [Haliotis rufescens]|uniref:uncharacterized protein LOC124130706 n=1 Tax=Haliotis rufescens TaxID=6454 RepID=UPI00201F045C|nr:uncharacterized protein LOC124130706 [Haliotis rufescens]XP_048243895.1 uncharacterized protein LOC124130706 [Haliotis rufescens]
MDDGKSRDGDEIEVKVIDEGDSKIIQNGSEKATANRSDSQAPDMNMITQSDSSIQDIDQSESANMNETEDELPDYENRPSDNEKGITESQVYEETAARQSDIIKNQSEDSAELSVEERDLGVYEDEDESDFDEAVADLDLELEPEILGEKLIDSMLRKGSKSATSTRKSRIESALSNIDEAEELSQPSCVEDGVTTVDVAQHGRRPATSGCETDAPLSRAKVNTPASISAYTDVTAEIRNLESRDTTRNLETREAVFRRALTLMSNRCTSVTQNPADVTMPSALISVDEPPFGVTQPEYFYIHQRRPSPMAPLKAWRGYNGNVYFEPISIKSVSKGKATDPSDAVQAAQLAKYDPRLGVSSYTPSARPASTPPSRSNTRESIRSSVTRRPITQRQMTVFDRGPGTPNFNPRQQENLAWVEKQQETGSLAMRPPSSSSREAKLAACNREKIVKGSVVQRLREQKQAGLRKPQLTVNGDKFTPAHTMSPLLRTQTQYSHSNQRMTMNSPDPHHSVYDHLPPLDQIRASLRHMEHVDSMSEPSYNRLSPYGRKVTLTDELKPFIKYSPDIRAKYLKRVQYLT